MGSPARSGGYLLSRMGLDLPRPRTEEGGVHYDRVTRKQYIKPPSIEEVSADAAPFRYAHNDAKGAKCFPIAPLRHNRRDKPKGCRSGCSEKEDNVNAYD